MKEKSTINQTEGKSARELAAELSMQGMNIKEVSIALGIPYGTVYGWLRKKTDKGASGSNADRHLCKTCQYRAGSYDRNNAGMNCNYWDLMKHSRGCKVEECTVYVKGPMLKVRKKRSIRLRNGGKR